MIACDSVSFLIVLQSQWQILWKSTADLARCQRAEPRMIPSDIDGVDIVPHSMLSCARPSNNDSLQKNSSAWGVAAQSVNGFGWSVRHSCIEHLIQMYYFHPNSVTSVYIRMHGRWIRMITAPSKWVPRSDTSRSLSMETWKCLTVHCRPYVCDDLCLTGHFSTATALCICISLLLFCYSYSYYSYTFSDDAHLENPLTYLYHQQCTQCNLP